MGGVTALKQVSQWAELHLKIDNPPCYMTMTIILRSKIQIVQELHSFNSEKISTVMSIRLEEIIRDWVNEIWVKGIFFTYLIIQENSRHTQYSLNQHVLSC